MSAEGVKRWLRPRRELAPTLLATLAVWALPAILITMGDVQPGCTPTGCLQEFLGRLFPGSLVYLVLTYPIAAGVTVGVERRRLDTLAPWLFSPSSSVAKTAVGLGIPALLLMGFAGGHALFTPVGKWILYTLFVPVFDALLALRLFTAEPGIRSIWVTIAIGLPVVICQVCWWYGIAHMLVASRRRLRR